MTVESIEETLADGGKSNSLGRVDEVITAVLNDKKLLYELYKCMFSKDPWVRMRAADAFEKICRQKPEWIKPYISRIQIELSDSNQQPSIQWHIAQIYQQVALTEEQKKKALSWLEQMLSSRAIDWIVAANCMKTLAQFVERGDYSKPAFMHLLQIQMTHKSNAVVKKATQLAASLARR